MEYSLNFDGACEPRNPGGPGSWGYVIVGPEGGPITGMGSIPAASTTTNNVAEYWALGHGLRHLELAFTKGEWQRPDAILIRGDSKLVICQLNGEWACRAPGLIPLLARGRQAGYPGPKTPRRTRSQSWPGKRPPGNSFRSG